MNVIFLAFSNNSIKPLEALTLEDDSIYKELTPGAFKQNYILHRDSFTTILKMVEFLEFYQNHVRIFHFGGHAGSQSLLLNNEKAHSIGLIRLLGKCKRLELVVLNGCSTYGQVELLLNAGIKLVIATNAKVEDGTSSKFAQIFYAKLKSGMSYEDAFNAAIDFVSIYDPSIPNVLNRGAVTSYSEDIGTWGLYYREGNEKYLKNGLPNKDSFEIEEEFIPNVILLEEIWNNIPGNKKSSFEDSYIKQNIVNRLPSPIGEQLKKLIIDDNEEENEYVTNSLIRLTQCVKTYQVMVELLTFTLLSQLWETRISNDGLDASIERFKIISDFLYKERISREAYDFISLNRSIRYVIEKNEGTYFVEELGKLKDLFYHNEAYAEAFGFYEVLKINLFKENVDESQLSELCQRAEINLAIILSNLFFLVNYDLISVQRIDVQKYRHWPTAEYNHMVIKLKDSLGGHHLSSIKDFNLLDNRSVILLNTRQNKFLSLLPFIIDRSAFEGNSKKPGRRGKKYWLFALSHFDKKKNEYVYRDLYKSEHSQNTLYISENTKQYTMIFDQLEEFRKILMPKKDV